MDFLENLRNRGRGDKGEQIMNALILAEMLVVDPDFTNRYHTFVHTPGVDGAEKMRADIMFTDKLMEARREGTVSPIDVLKLKAQALAGLTEPLELWKGITDHGRQFKDEFLTKKDK